MALTTFVAGNVLTAQQLNDSYAAVKGLGKEIPTSVTVSGGGSSGSVSASGTVTFTTCATVSLNGCFTATYDNYLVVCDLDGSVADADMEFRMRVGGSDNSTASSYTRQDISANGAAISTARTSSSAGRLGAVSSTSTNGFTVAFFRPFLADNTAIIAESASGYLSAYSRYITGTHNQNTSYDGFSLLPTSGTITGKISVYGFWL